jgi:hypothetical protein
MCDFSIPIVDHRHHHIVEIGVRVHSILKLFFRKAKQSFIKEIDTILEIIHRHHKAKPRAQKIDPRYLISESVDKGLDEGDPVFRRNVVVPIVYQGAAEAGHNFDAGHEARVEHPFFLLFGLDLGHRGQPALHSCRTPLIAEQLNNIRVHIRDPILSDNPTEYHQPSNPLPDPQIRLILMLRKSAKQLFLLLSEHEFACLQVSI